MGGGTHPGRSHRESSLLGRHNSTLKPGHTITSRWKKLLHKLLCPGSWGGGASHPANQGQGADDHTLMPCQ